MFTMKSLIKASAAAAVCAAAYFGYAAYRAERLEEAEERLEQDGIELAKRQEFMMTRDPQLNAIPTGRLLQANNYRQSMIDNGRTASLPWIERGPNNVGGRTRAILIDRADPTGNTVLASSVSGGIFRTTNFSTVPAVWVPVAERMSNLAIGCMVQDRTNPAIMYAGTGEGWFNIDAVKGGGIFKSTDGGLTWNILPATTDFEYCQDIVQDLNGNLYVTLRNSLTVFRGIMRSVDGGATWTQIAGLPFTELNYRTGRAADLEVASNGDIYATLGIFSPAMVIKSPASNGAATGAAGTWIDVTPPYAFPTNRSEIAISPSNPQRIYFFGQDSTNSQVSEAFRSDNGGQTWFAITPPAGVNNGSVSQNWYNLIAAVDPNNPDIVVAGGFQVTRSTDGGQSWLSVSGSMHVDNHVIEFINSNRVIVGNDGGIFVANSFSDQSPFFESKNAGFNVTQFYGADFHPTNANYFLAGAQDNNTLRFTAAGLNNTTAVVGGDGGIPHIDQTDGNLQIAAYVGNSYYRSLNGGSFQALSGNSSGTGQFINPTDLDDASKVLYCGDEAGKLTVITNLTGTPGRAVRTISAMGTREVTAVRVDNSASNTVWLGCSLGSGNKPQLIKLTNANTAAPTVSTNVQITGSVAGAAISSIDIDPANPAHLVVTLSNFGVASIWESINSGTSWTNIEGNMPDMPVRWVQFLPSDIEPNGAGNGAGGLMVGTELGVWFATSISGAATNWQPYTNFPNTPVYMLKYRASDRLMMAATHGRGLWTAILTRATGVSNVTATRDFIKYVSSANNRLTIVPGTLNIRRMNIEVFDTRGSLVHRESRAYNTAQLPTDRWSRGAYIVRITGDKGEVFVQQVVR
ncbi:MAG: T9SS type A sorting domain-containing protein [Chitinophagaceae bacterium]|nr:MAG: T9SS type A sorting domain-containing protein [Chitinophagaceae bacterium]